MAGRGQITLTVPPSHRDKVLELGARWDKKNARVWLPANRPRAPFLPWMPSGVETGTVLFPPLFLLTGHGVCWSCHEPVVVAGVGAEEAWPPGYRDTTVGFGLLAQIAFLPQWVSRLIQGVVPHYTYAYFHRGDHTHKILGNHCPYCHRLQGDAHLIQTPGGYLHPRRGREADALTLHLLVSQRSLAAPGHWTPIPLASQHARSGTRLADSG